MSDYPLQASSYRPGTLAWGNSSGERNRWWVRIETHFSANRSSAVWRPLNEFPLGEGLSNCVSDLFYIEITRTPNLVPPILEVKPAEEQEESVVQLLYKILDAVTVQQAKPVKIENHISVDPERIHETVARLLGQQPLVELKLSKKAKDYERGTVVLGVGKDSAAQEWVCVERPNGFEQACRMWTPLGHYSHREAKMATELDAVYKVLSVPKRGS